ncbi:hypothetical protein [Exiguobacterium sp. s22]|uniref:hypothetical protein n=1 Tax=Exiguobacterium sp. s22 TaxID=2751272 RepID=UPI001BECB6AE|nr:hypothetical protein [Exiguobacterium sp. s22]
MDMTRYEKINGREALRRLLDGEEVYAESGEKYRIDPSYDRLYYVPTPMHHENLSVVNVNDVFRDDWYIKKPFDVRQAMRDKPDEWVGAFKNDGGVWCKVGFDSRNHMAIEVILSHIGAPFFESVGAGYALSAELDACIPLDEVPEDAR